jgi:hypothetical protein
MIQNRILLLFIILTSLLYAQEIRHEKVNINFADNPSQVKALKEARFSEDGIEISSAKGVITGEGIKVPFSDASPFLTVAPILKGSNLFQQKIEIHLHGSKDGYTYDESYTVEIDEHVELSEGLAFNAVFFDYRTKYIKYEIKLLSAREDLSLISEIEFTFISPGATPSDQLEKIKEKGELINSTDINFNPDLSTPESLHYPRPPVVTRTEWGCPVGQGSAGTPSITIPTHLIVHHSAGGNSSSDWPAIVRSYYTLHTVTNGWSDIGYNWLIDANGVVYQGRAWFQNSNDDVIGAHFCAQNSRSMGVCVMGTFTSVPPSQQAYTALVKVLAYKASQKGIDPKGISLHTGSNLTLNHVSGHSNGCNTTCPGGVLLNSLPVVRNRVFALLNPPIVQTSDPDSVTLTSAVIKGVVNPNSSVTSAYFQYGINSPSQNTPLTLAGAGSSDVTVSATLEGLIPFTRYAYRVAASNTDTSSIGITKFFNTTLTSPAVPVAVSPANNAANVPVEYSFIWYSAEGAIYYYLQIATDSAFNNLAINDATLLDTFKVINLSHNQTYFWRIAAQNQNGTSAFSLVNKFETAAAAPAIVALLLPLNGTTLDSASVTLSWTPVNGAANYWVEIDNDSLFTSPLIDSTLTGNTYLYSNFSEGNYFWRVRGGNSAGWGEFSSTWSFNLTLNSVNDGSIVAGYHLYSNYPNPFNPSTTIKFRIPETGVVSMKVYDMLGKEIKTLVNEEMSSGEFNVSWDGRNNSGEMVSSGSYIINMNSGSYNSSIKVALMK